MSSRNRVGVRKPRATTPGLLRSLTAAFGSCMRGVVDAEYYDDGDDEDKAPLMAMASSRRDMKTRQWPNGLVIRVPAAMKADLLTFVLARGVYGTVNYAKYASAPGKVLADDLVSSICALDPAPGPEEMADAYWQAGGFLSEAGHWTDAYPLLERAAELLGNDAGATEQMAWILHSKGLVKCNQRKYGKARSLLEASMRMHAQRGDSWGSSVALGSVASCDIDEYGDQDVEPAIEKLLCSMRSLRQEGDSLHLAVILYNLGSAHVEHYSAHGDAEAGAYFREALAMKRRVFGVPADQDHPAFAGELSSLGVLLARQGNLEESIAISQRALAVRMQLLGPDHPGTVFSKVELADCLVNGAETLFRRGGHADKRATAWMREAIDHCLRAEALEERVFDPEDRNHDLRGLLRQTIYTYAPSLHLAPLKSLE